MENCRDLLMFIERYPMEVTPRETLELAAECHREQEITVAKLLERDCPLEDFVLALPARDYQAKAAELALTRSGLLVADDLGLGKTVTAICLMALSQNLPVLVVTLTHLPGQWAAEIGRFAPSLKIHILKTGQPYDIAKKGTRDVIISNYHKLNGWAESLAGIVRYVVFDEVQELRHADSAKYQAARLIAASASVRMGLSATPIYNYGSEFYSVVDVLLPDTLGTREEFLREWCVDEKRIGDPRAFGEYLRREGIMIAGPEAMSAGNCRASRASRMSSTATNPRSTRSPDRPPNSRGSFSNRPKASAGIKCGRAANSICSCGRRRESARRHMSLNSSRCF
jgi:SNF2 family DNA or RNA helicase